MSRHVASSIITIPFFTMARLILWLVVVGTLVGCCGVVAAEPVDNVTTTTATYKIGPPVYPTVSATEFRFVQEDGDTPRQLTLKEGDTPLWRYNGEFAAIPNVPEKDARHKAGCYIHPLFGLNGEILTDDAPRDHYHHHGVFWTWPHVRIHRPDGNVENYDIWTGNTRLKQLFVRFVSQKTDNGKGQSVFTVENGWFLAPTVNEYTLEPDGTVRTGTAEKVVTEFVTITTHRIQQHPNSELCSRAIDIDLKWVIGENPVTLQGADGKSYGGLTVRFRPSTDKPGGDSLITTPDGVAATDLPDTPLPWADYTSVFGRDEKNTPTGGRSGAAIFVPKTHPNYPPTWLTRYYGPLCVGWPGVQSQTFQSGDTIKLSYRIWIHDREVDVETLKNVYQQYLSP